MGKWSNIGKDYWDIVWLVKFQKEVCLCGLENVQNVSILFLIFLRKFLAKFIQQLQKMYLSKQKEAHKLI
jgi:hypothetical protein